MGGFDPIFATAFRCRFLLRRRRKYHLRVKNLFVYSMEKITKQALVNWRIAAQKAQGTATKGDTIAEI
jgi:hypothetical protein